MSRLTIQSEAGLREAAEVSLRRMEDEGSAHILTLQGDLGAGKTAFTKALARSLGVYDEVTSPTFVIMKSYPIIGHNRFATLVHVDAYRIDDEAELQVLGFEDVLQNPENLVVIEWPERIPNLIPNDALRVTIEIIEGNDRLITYAD